VPARPPIDSVSHNRWHNWVIGNIAAAIALAALVVGSEFGEMHTSQLHPKLIAWISAAVVLVAGIIATARLSAALSHLVRRRSIQAAAGAVGVLSAGVGYLIVAFSVLAVLEVSIEHLLVGAGLAGVVLGIAAQQSLGNVFAGLVLLIARPFGVGDHVRIRAGALGGIFEAWVVEMSLTYVTLRTDDGPLKVPNSAMLAAGVGQLPTTDIAVPTPAPPSTPASPPPPASPAPPASPSTPASGTPAVFTTTPAGQPGT
jgi:small-conductance mechanosensitive channel